MSSSDKPRSSHTLAVHGSSRGRFSGALLTPTFHSTVYGVPDEVDSYLDIGYPRLSTTPNQMELGAKLAALEGAENALGAASGMAAISTALLSALSAGDHLIVQDQLYGGTHGLVHHDLPRFGIEVTAVARAADMAGAIRPNTRAIYVEAMSNPLLRVVDHRAVVALAREHNLVSILDSTFAPPVLWQPIALGYDLVVHSATKFLNGHSDLVAGALVGGGEPFARARTLLAHFGGTLAPECCVLLDRGVKTLPLRVRRQSASAQAIAEFLAGHPAIERVHYPGLPTHPEHRLASELFSAFGGMLAVELVGGLAAAAALAKRLDLFYDGPSLGGVESLLTRPAHTSHRSLSAEERARLGISDGLVRFSIGLEDPSELIADLERGLSS